MNTNLKFSRPGGHTSMISFQGNVSRRMGNMRAVSLEREPINADLIFGASARIDADSIKNDFRQLAHDLQLEADRRSYELKGLNS